MSSGDELALPDASTGSNLDSTTSQSSPPGASNHKKKRLLDRVHEPLKKLAEIVTSVQVIVATIVLAVTAVVGTQIRERDGDGDLVKTSNDSTPRRTDQVDSVDDLRIHATTCFQGLASPVLVAAASDGSVVAASGGQRVRLANPTCDASEEVTLPKDERVSSIVLSPDARLLYIASSDGLLRRFSTSPLVQLSDAVKASELEVTDLAVAPDGSVLSGSADGRIRLWTSELTAEPIGESTEADVGAAIEDLAIGGVDEHFLAVALTGTGEVSEIDLVRGRVNDDPWGTAECDVRAIAATPRRVYLFGTECVDVIDVAESRSIDDMPASVEHMQIAGETPRYASAGTSSDEDIVVVSGTGGSSDSPYGFTKIWYVDRDEVRRIDRSSSQPSDAAISADSQTLVWVAGDIVQQSSTPAV